MAAAVSLEQHLAAGIEQGLPLAREVAATVLALTRAGCAIADLLAAGPLSPDLARQRGEGRGDVQKELDLRADQLVLEALREAPVAWMASEELDQPALLNPGAALAVAIDPLDGSSNIDTNCPVGTIFSLLPSTGGEDGAAEFLRPGHQQVAAGFLIYGPHTALVLTQGEGTRVFTLDRTTNTFMGSAEAVRVALSAHEYAINASNARHWSPSVRSYIEDCLRGTAGSRGRDFNTRWIASMVADAYRILVRGGVYLYPADARAGYREGRLRLVYEANPIAWIIEQAGGAATDGARRILDLKPHSVHQRVPLVFGAVEEVTRIAHLHADPPSERSEPLFATRSLFRSAIGPVVLA